MSTKRYTPGWTLGNIVTSLLGMAAWYGVDCLLEPKPLWVRNEYSQEQCFYPTSYATDLRLLAGFEYHYDRAYPKIVTDTELVVLDIGIGNTIDRLNLGQVRFQGISQHLTNIGPHLAGDRAYRFALRVEKEQEIVELRSWGFGNDQQERVEHTWHVDLMNWRTEWNSHEPDQFLIYYQFPMISTYLRAPPVVSGFGQVLSEVYQHIQDVRPSIFESWKVSPSIQKRCSWVQPLFYSHWTSPGRPNKHYTLAIENGTVFETDTSRGTTRSIPNISLAKHVGLLYADERWLMVRNLKLVVINQANGVQEQQFHHSPSPHSQVKWTYDEWRPIYNLQTGERVHWPHELDISKLGYDTVVVDAHDTSRLLYFSQVEQPTSSSPRYNYHLMTVEDGKLKLASSWKNDAILNLFMAKFNQQLLTTVDEIVFPPQYYRWIPDTPRIQDLIYWFIPEQRRSVALIDEKTGKILWKRHDREILNIAGITEQMNWDFILLEHFNFDQAPLVRVKEYECWASPIVIYSAWWARGVGALVMALLILVLRSKRLQPPRDWSVVQSLRSSE